MSGERQLAAGAPSTEKATVIEPDAALLAALTEFSAAAGHEINNPLAVILGRVQLLLQSEPQESRRQALETIAGQAWRIRDMIGDLMLFAQPPEPEKTVVALTLVLTQLRETVFPDACGQDSARTTQPGLRIAADDSLRLQADAAQLSQVLAEILRNALHPTVGSTQVELLAERCAEDGRLCLIRIRDNGRGLTPAEAVQLFNPFFSGRQAGRGLGFGLCKAWRLATLNAATIKVLAKGETEQPGTAGFRTEFQIRWPLAEG